MDTQERSPLAHRRPVHLQFRRSIHGGTRETPAELGPTHQARPTFGRGILRVPSIDAPFQQYPLGVEGDRSDGGNPGSSGFASARRIVTQAGVYVSTGDGTAGLCLLVPRAENDQLR